MTLDAELVAAALPNYEVSGELGRGGMGVVLGGRHRTLGRSVAIKQLPRAFAADPAVRARFVAEARLLASLTHPHIVPVYDFVESDGLCLLVMEALPGGSVWTRFSTEGFTPETACCVAMAACAGLHHAHAHGVLHRDVKPDNLLFADDGIPKVTDFGIAKVVGGSETYATSAGEVLGTPAYMAPEQAQGHELTPATDVYAVGVMLYELLAGQLPFSEDGDALAIIFRHVYEDPIPLPDVAPGVAPVLADVVMRAISRSVADRYASAEDFAVAIGEGATAAWGVGWLARADAPLIAPGRILASTEHLAADPGAAATPVREVTTPTPHESPPSTPAPPTLVPGALPVTPAPPTVVPEAMPATPVPAQATERAVARTQTARVRPRVTVHVAGADVDGLQVAELVPVRKVLGRTRFPAVQLGVAILLFALAVAVAFAGLGTPSRRGELAAGAVTVAGIDIASGDRVELDLNEPIQVRVAEASRVPPDSARVRLRALGVPLGSSTRALEPTDDGLHAAIDLSGSRYLVGGTVTAELSLIQDGQVVATHEFAARSSGTGIVTVPGVVAVVLVLVALSFAESVLGPVRRGRRRAAAPFQMAVIGAGFGLAMSLLAWAIADPELSVASVATSAALGAGGGAVLAVAAASLGRRRRARRRSTMSATV